MTEEQGSESIKGAAAAAEFEEREAAKATLLDEAGNYLLDPARGPVERCQSVIAQYTKHGDTRGDFNLDDVEWLIGKIVAKDSVLTAIRATTMVDGPPFNVGNVRSLCNAALPAGSGPAVKQMLPDHWAELRAIRASEDWKPVVSDVPCNKCPVVGQIEGKEVNSSCGGFEDRHYRCKACGGQWWYESGDA